VKHAVLGAAVGAALLAALLVRDPGPVAGAATLSPSPRPAATPGPTAEMRRRARRTLDAMTVREKAAQLVFVRGPGLPRHPRSREWRDLTAQVRDLKVGGVVIFDAELGTLTSQISELQKLARVPLLVAADMERGMSFRVRRGVAPLPYAMAIGATRSTDDARFAGELAAREGRALGIHWALAPVADVNVNPENPIINIRSYGEDPALVAEMSAAYVAGARAGGLLTTVKHFPGHGDTRVDSHLKVPTIGGDRARLDRIELLPFRRAIEAGVDAVMLGHIAVPALDAEGAPATLSAPIVKDVLRGELGFRGLVVTDALDMDGLRSRWTGEAAVSALRAGADVLLLPPNPEVAVSAVERAVREGQLTVARLDESVLRLLELKERLTTSPTRPSRADLGRPEDVDRVMDIARRSITVVRNEHLPLRAEEPSRILHLVLSSDVRNDMIQGFLEEELAARRVDVSTVILGPEISAETVEGLVARAREHTHVLASTFARITAGRGTAAMTDAHARLLERIQEAGRSPIVVSFGSPYLLRQMPWARTYLCAYGSAESSQRAAIGALFGEFDLRGRLPVTLPGLYAYGHGLDVPGHAMSLRSAPPEAVGFRPGGLAALDRVMEEAVAARSFPGGVVAVGKDGALVHLRAFGHQTYDEGSPPIAVDTIYDLASLTKVVATTTAAMILVDEGRLDLARPVSSFLPRFTGGGKEKVTVQHLLTHSGGLDWWVPLYKEAPGREAMIERILAMPLGFEPGTKSVYTDLGVLLLGEILERVAAQDLRSFVEQRILQPLGMRDTGYLPPASLKPRIAPTEFDPWRGRLVHGEVHDENASSMGGVAPHAGLFGTASDLARFAQTMLNGGVLEHRRLVSRAVVERFTQPAGIPGSSRALGWDTPSGRSSAGDWLSARSFGHTGFTGTSLWIDPERKLFLVILTNRVHPTRTNDAIRDVRRAAADAVVQALVDPGQPRPQ
jgi:beta-N-acetylhexosaminidase